MSKRSRRRKGQRAMAQHTEAVIKRLNDDDERYFQTWRDRQLRQLQNYNTPKKETP